MTKTKLGALIAAVLVFTACGNSLEDEIHLTGRCYRAAKHLGDQGLMIATHTQMSLLANKMAQAENGREMLDIRFNQRLNDEMYPDGDATRTDVTQRVLLEWRASKFCAEIYERGLREP